MCLPCVFGGALFVFAVATVLVFIVFLGRGGLIISPNLALLLNVTLLALIVATILVLIYGSRRSARTHADRLARRMRVVPFSVLQGRIDDMKVRRLVREFQMRPEVARTLIDQEIKEPEDLLRLPGFLRLATPHELWQLLKESPPPVPEAITLTEISVDAASGATIGVRTTAGGKSRVFIADEYGDLISAESSSEQLVDFASLRFLGCHVYELANLDSVRLQNLIGRLHSRVSVRAGLIWRREKSGPASIREPVQTLSRLLRVLQAFTFRAAESNLNSSVGNGGTVAAGSGNISPTPGGIVPATGALQPGDEDQVNGCGSASVDVPDFDFKDCCDEHDRCYLKGCTECDRLTCDWNLYTCIINKGLSLNKDYTSLAALYYLGVRSFGGSYFNYCRERDPTYVTASGLAGAALAVVGGVVGYAFGGPLGSAVGAALGAAVGVLATYGLGLIFCHICESVVAAEQEITQQVQRALQSCWSQWKKCKKKKHWWQRLLCRVGAVIVIIICTIVLGLFLVIVRIVTFVLKVAFC